MEEMIFSAETAETKKQNFRRTDPIPALALSQQPKKNHSRCVPRALPLITRFSGGDGGEGRCKTFTQFLLHGIAALFRRSVADSDTAGSARRRPPQ